MGIHRAGAGVAFFKQPVGLLVGEDEVDAAVQRLGI